MMPKNLKTPEENGEDALNMSYGFDDAEDDGKDGKDKKDVEGENPDEENGLGEFQSLDEEEAE